MPTRRNLLIAGAALTVGGCQRDQAGDAYKLRAADIHVDGYPTVAAMRSMRALLLRLVAALPGLLLVGVTFGGIPCRCIYRRGKRRSGGAVCVDGNLIGVSATALT